MELRVMGSGAAGGRACAEEEERRGAEDISAAKLALECIGERRRGEPAGLSEGHSCGSGSSSWVVNGAK